MKRKSTSTKGRWYVVPNIDLDIRRGVGNEGKDPVSRCRVREWNFTIGEVEWHAKEGGY